MLLQVSDAESPCGVLLYGGVRLTRCVRFPASYVDSFVREPVSGFGGLSSRPHFCRFSPTSDLVYVLLSLIGTSSVFIRCFRSTSVWLRVGILGDKKEFINNYVKPVKLAKDEPKFRNNAMRRLKHLTALLKPLALRRDVAYLKYVCLCVCGGNSST